MSIVTISTLTMFIVCMFISMVHEVLSYWELLIPALFLIPAYAYCKQKQKIVNVFLLTMIVNQVARFTILPTLAVKGHICVPISINDMETCNIIGFITIVCILFYYALLYAMCYVTLKDLIKKSKDYRQLTHNLGIQNILNMFNSSTVTTILVLMMCIFGYKLSALWSNVALFILIVAGVSIVFQVQVINDIRERKEDFLEELHKKDSEEKELEILEENENGSGESKE